MGERGTLTRTGVGQILSDYSMFSITIIHGSINILYLASLV